MKTTTTVHDARPWHPTRGRLHSLVLRRKEQKDMTPDDPFCLPYGRHVVRSAVHAQFGITLPQLERSGLVPCCSRVVYNGPFDAQRGEQHEELYFSRGDLQVSLPSNIQPHVATRLLELKL